MVKKAKRPRRRRREALVHQHLENASRKLLEKHPDVVRQFIGRNAGIYALYRKNKLYYVGLANALRGRLKAHVKNRHGNSWDRFSIYLTIKDQHLREIEALLLRIANPPGAKQRGRLAQSKDMRRERYVKNNIRKSPHSSAGKLPPLKASRAESIVSLFDCYRKEHALEERSKIERSVREYDATEKSASTEDHTIHCHWPLKRQFTGRQMDGGFGRLSVDEEIGYA